MQLLAEDESKPAPRPLAKAAPKGPFLFRGVISDLRHRAPLYASDWTEGLGFGLLRPATYIFMVSVIPALAFGEQLGECPQSLIPRSVQHVADLLSFLVALFVCA